MKQLTGLCCLIGEGSSNMDITITAAAAEAFILEHGDSSETGFRLYLADKS